MWWEIIRRTSEPYFSMKEGPTIEHLEDNFESGVAPRH